MEDINNAFVQRLSEGVSRVSGCILAGIVGMDGITIAEFKDDVNFDSAISAAELASVVADSRRCFEDLKEKELEECIVRSNELTFVIRLVNPDFFIYLALKGENQNLGLARFEAKKISEEFKTQLA
uniref:Roadblock/LAMTOR2 domain-containing protein n=1 Tax=candidate division WOR-3 bacterium TaxID=2052148 RepID=A0A7C4YI89_UNCW3